LTFVSDLMTDSKAKASSAPVEIERAKPVERARANPARVLGELRHSPEKIKELFREGRYPYKTKIRRPVYDRHKKELQVELLKVQNWVKMTGQKIVVLFEGRDAAGKGGTIKRFMEHLNPRAARVVALEKPTEHEQGQWYFQRYVEHLPTKGEMVFFDRSWYNSGIRLFKYWFSVTHEEQRRRFEARTHDPLKQWKLSPIDKESQGKWDEYTEAKEAMFFYTDTADAPWTIVKSDDKKRARLNCMQHFLSELDYPDKDLHTVHGPDPLIVGSSAHVISKDRHLWG
jgi:polyphosphate kinase 2 (PPK2 family)